MNRVLTLLLATCVFLTNTFAAETGADLRRVFAEARDGKPLRCVFLGGSITQSGNGWIEGWLRTQFPKSAVNVINSGMSATGSSLGIFRVERDVISHQPDLVAIEYCVNDGGLPDEDAIRYMECIIVRLKSLPHPPAIVILEAAAKSGVNLQRHRQVAQHYGLIEVDLQDAIDRRRKETGEAWETYFTDGVHPNKAGHQLYSETIAKTLEPFATGDAKAAAASKAALPVPLSSKPLILDGKMVGLYRQVNGWKRESSLPFWWNAFFMGVLSADAGGTGMTLPVRGSTFGIFFAMDKSYGTFFASVDEAHPRIVATNSRGGYSSAILAKDLPAQEHRIQIVLPAKSSDPAGAFLNGPVKLGYLLVAGEEQASTAVAPAGEFPTERLQALQYRVLPPKDWKWTGPYAPEAQPGAATPTNASDFMETAFPPETGTAEWKPVDAPEGATIDFRKLTGSDKPAVVYAVTEFASEKEADVFLAVAPDYFFKIWLNDESVTPKVLPSRGAADPIIIPVHLKAGNNRVLIKVGAGSGGFKLSTAIFQ